MGIDVIILAGAKNDGKLSQISDKDYEALIEINGKPMIDYLVDTLTQLDLIDKIIVVGPSILNNDNITTLIPCGNSLLDNIKMGLNETNSLYSLLCTSDIPLLTVEAVNDFLIKCEKKRADFYYPIITKETIEKKFYNSNRTYFEVNDGVFTGGNCFLVNGEVILELEDLLYKILKWRKKPWKLAYLLGFKFIVKLLTANLSISLVEEEVYNLTGYRGKAVILDHPEIGFDIDTPQQLDMAERFYQSFNIKMN